MRVVSATGEHTFELSVINNREAIPGGPLSSGCSNRSFLSLPVSVASEIWRPGCGLEPQLLGVAPPLGSRSPTGPGRVRSNHALVSEGQRGVNPNSKA